MPQAFRTVLALMVSYCTLVVIVVICSLLTRSLLHVEAGQVTKVYLLANVLYSMLAALVGGWLMAYIAGTMPLRHGALLAVFVLGFTVLGMGHPITGETMLYRVMIAVLMTLSIIGGAATERKA